MFRASQGSATIEINVLRSETRQQHWTDFEIPVSRGFTLIGGGGMASDNPGALLTASYPNPTKTAWRVSSKDHITPDAHILTGFSIGLMLDEFPERELTSKVLVVQETSDPAPHPMAIATAPNQEYVVIGGGFKVHQIGAGNLATASFPNNTPFDDEVRRGLPGWEVRSKDHEIPSPTTITAYAICLPARLEFFDDEGIFPRSVGYEVVRHITPGTEGPPPAIPSPVAVPHPFAIDHVVEGFLLTGGGAIAHWDRLATPGLAGSLLWCLAPLPYEEPSKDPLPPGHEEGRLAFLGRSKDHGAPSPTTITSVAISVRFNQYRPER